MTVARALDALPPGARPVMVGDRKYDISAARTHGLPAVGVLWGVAQNTRCSAPAPIRSSGHPRISWVFSRPDSRTEAGAAGAVRQGQATLRRADGH